MAKITVQETEVTIVAFQDKTIFRLLTWQMPKKA